MRLSRVSDGGLDRFAAALDSLATDAPRLLGEAAAEGGEAALASEFAAQKGPEGSPWAKRVPPTGSWPILRKTGRMFGSRTADPGQSEAVFSMASPAEFHQHGTRRMVARPILPSRELPPLWREAIAKAVRARIADRLGAS